MKILPFPAVTLILTLALACAAFPLAAADDGENHGQGPRTISVTGEGTMSAPPDMAHVTTGVVTQAGTAGAALADNTAAMETVMSTLVGQGIAERDIQTTNFSVQPQYQRGAAGGQRPKITGYQVTNNVRVRVRDLAKLGALLDALVKAGSNQVSGISFSIDEPETLFDRAREKAVASARSRAELYARSSGVKLGKVLSISEQSAATPFPRPMERAAFAAASASAVPIASGEQELRAIIHVVYAIEDD